MPYYPSNRIVTNLYTNGGEFLVSSTSLPYQGYYYKLYNGTSFTGKTPNDGVSQLLIPISELQPKPSQEFSIVSIVPRTQRSLELKKYLGASGASLNNKFIPITYYPKPTKQDYELGEIQRYFAKKQNEFIFIEIDKKTFNNLFFNDPAWLWQLYIPFNIPWEITGETQTVAEINRKITLLAEKDYKVLGFYQFIEKTGGFNKFYQFPNISNLYTSGSEFKTADGRNYIGFYHIHDKTGPMVGATHTKEPHGLLFPINETIVSKAINPQIPQVITQTTSSYTPPSSLMSTGGGFGGGGGFSGGGGGGGY